VGEKCSDKFGLESDFHVILGIFNMPQICDMGQTALLPLRRTWLTKLNTSKYFKALIFNTQLFVDDQFIISDTEDNLQQAVSLLQRISKEYNLEIATKKTEVLGFVGTDHLRTKIIINNETLEQVSQFTYLGYSRPYQFSNDVEFKLAKFLQLTLILLMCRIW